MQRIFLSVYVSFLSFHFSWVVMAEETTVRTMLKQAAVQPRPNEYPQKLLAALLFPVKTDIDTSKKIAEKVIHS